MGLHVFAIAFFCPDEIAAESRDIRTSLDCHAIEPVDCEIEHHPMQRTVHVHDGIRSTMVRNSLSAVAGEHE